MKLPNGFGTCYRQAGNRRRPWVVKKTIKWKQKTVGYFKDYEHGMSFLVDYKRDTALFSSDINFKELYARWRGPMHCSARLCMTWRSAKCSTASWVALICIMRSMNASTHAAINNSIHIITSNKKRYTINLGVPRICSLSVLDKATTNIFCIFFQNSHHLPPRDQIRDHRLLIAK